MKLADKNITMIRKFEEELDGYPSTLPICRRHLGQVIFHLLLAHEHVFHYRILSSSGKSVLQDAEELKKGLKHALDWAYEYCASEEGSFAPEFSTEIYSEAIDLLQLGCNYQIIYCMFSLMNNRRELISAYFDEKGFLHLDYNPDQFPFEVLSFITAENYQNSQQEFIDANRSTLQTLNEAISNILENSVLEFPGKVQMTIERADYDGVRDIIRNETSGAFRLPDNWSFRSISISDFRKVLLSLRTHATISAIVHSDYLKEATDPSKGYPIFETFVWTGSKEQLVKRITEMEPELSEQIVDSVLSLLVYDRSCSKPDPALQPIIPYHDVIMIPPRLIVHSNLERNLVALLAREYKNEYDKTTALLEPNLLAEISSVLRKRGFIVLDRVRLPGRSDLGDIDLLAYEPRLRKLIIAEVKWVIPPGEPYDQLSRADTEEKAIRNQLVPIVNYARKSYAELLRILSQPVVNLTESDIVGILLMRGFCGMKHELSRVYPTVNVDSLLKKIESPKSNSELIDWIVNQEFLPKSGKDYILSQIPIKFGPYTIVINGFKLCR